MSPSAWRSIRSRRADAAARRRARNSWSRVRTPVVAPDPGRTAGRLHDAPPNRCAA